MLDKRQVKLGIYGFLVVLLTSMLSLKPYLFSALYHNFPTLHDSDFFANRTVHAKASTSKTWEVSKHLLSEPDQATAKLLNDLQTTALLVIENGKIVYEKYDQGGGPRVLSPSFSMSKSILSLMYGVALNEGRVKSLDEPVARYLPEWEERDEGKITIRNLLTMSSGLNWKESYTNPFSISAEAYYGRDLHNTALRQRLISEPGKAFSYQSGSTQILGLVLTRVTNATLSDYLSAKLWIPLGAEQDALWSLDHEDGMEKAFCCLSATARDYARIGELLRKQGKWGDLQIIESEFLNRAITPTGIPDAKGRVGRSYGEGFWVLKTKTESIPFAWGLLGQYIIVIPSKNRVVIRLGKKQGQVQGAYPAEIQNLADWAETAQ